MKHYERPDLNGLKKQFEELDASSASKMNGRTKFFDSATGEFPGNMGPSSTIRFMDSSQFSDIQANGGNIPGEFFDSFGYAFKDLTKIQQESFLGIHLPSAFEGSYDNYTYANCMGWTYIDGVLTFVYDPEYPDFENYSDFINSAFHENYHYFNNHFDGSPENEIIAINAMINHYTWDDTTKDHKFRIMHYLIEQWQRQGVSGTPGYTYGDALTICKIPTEEENY